MRTHIGHYHRPLRVLVRVAGLLAIAIVSLCSLFYLTLFLSPEQSTTRTSLTAVLPSLIHGNQEPFIWTDLPKRLIVFGDSWNDNGQYPIDPPSKNESPLRDAARGKVWTEWLCNIVGVTSLVDPLLSTHHGRSYVPITIILQGPCLIRQSRDFEALW